MASPALFNELRSFLTQIGAEKSAAAKKADAAQDPGGYSGKSSHPSAKQTGRDANLQAPVEGDRSAENESDVEEDVPNNVNTTPGNTGTQEQVQLGQGVRADETGVNVPHVKGDKEDPGTSHPATADDGEKYGSYAGRPFSELYKTAGTLANTILASIAAQAVHVPQESTSAATNYSASGPDETVKAAEAGYRLADLLAGQPSEEQIKVANAVAAVEQTIWDAFRAADLVADFQRNYIATKQAQAAAAAAYSAKRAADESDIYSGSEGESKPQDDDADDDDGGDESSDEGDVLDDIGGGGGSDQEATIEQLLQALLAMGVTPDMLLQSAQNLPDDESGALMAAMTGDGGPPVGGPPVGGPPGMEVAASHRKAASVKANLVKLARAAKVMHERQVKAGTFAVRPPKTAQEQRLRSQIQNCVREILASK